MDTPKPRTEDDLRAAFALAAQEAPAAGHVLAKVNAAERSREAHRNRGRWAPLAAVVAIGIVVGVPVTLIARHHSNGSSASSAGGADGAEKAAAASAPHNGFDGPAAAATSSAASANSGAPPGATSPTPGPLVANCTPADLSLSLVWHRDGGGLTGTLTATNTTSSACPLAVKPAIYPLGPDGQRLDVLDAQTTEGYAGPTQLAAGATTSSTATWGSWCGPAASTKAEVDWGSGVATVAVSGPTSPSCVTSGASNIVTTWFSPLS